jgi:hypothetical protein
MKGKNSITRHGVLSGLHKTLKLEKTETFIYYKKHAYAVDYL